MRTLTLQIYENGLQISTGLSSDSLFIEWRCIKGLSRIEGVFVLYGIL